MIELELFNAIVQIPNIVPNLLRVQQANKKLSLPGRALRFKKMKIKEITQYSQVDIHNNINDII